MFSNLLGGRRCTRWVLGAAKPGAQRRRGLERLVVAGLSALGRFRCCAAGLRGLRARQAQRLKHHVPGGLLTLCSAGRREHRFSRRPLGEPRRTRSGRPFCNSNLPPKPIRKKGRKETPAFSYCASAPALPAVPPPSAGRAPYAAHEPRSLETGAGLRLPVSRKRARADVNLGAGASSSGLGCRLKWGRLRVFQAVRALVAAEGPATHEEFRRGRSVSGHGQGPRCPRVGAAGLRRGRPRPSGIVPFMGTTA
ncbi:uncharacterized protein [Symphalangus syndactylus]|uniref:uncharacterized protein isoform X3 n=1 Tax=Symphalangus syndactylus TaxID=9590 RepID=UPI0030058F64